MATSWCVFGCHFTRWNVHKKTIPSNNGEVIMEKRKPTKYTIVKADSSEKLINYVNEHIKKGWELKGCCSFSATQSGCATYYSYIQTMVRYD